MESLTNGIMEQDEIIVLDLGWGSAKDSEDSDSSVSEVIEVMMLRK